MALPVAASAAGPPPPVSSGGHAVKLVAGGLQTPTSFAFGDGTMFAGDAGNPPEHPGGVYMLRNGIATRLDGSPPIVFGLAWHGDTLYVSAYKQLLAWSGWNGTSFTDQKVIYTGPKDFTGFDGIGFGANGRLYAGVFLGITNDHSPTSRPYAFDVLSFNARGGDLKVVARGLRQPFQLAFPKGSSEPFVSDLGQDDPANLNPPDFVDRVHPGDNFGFPTCNWVVMSACAGFTKPFKFLPPHSSAMGLGIIGNRLYMALFGGIGSSGPEVVSLPVTGGDVTPVLTGFAAPVVGLTTHEGAVYVGDLTGSVYRVKP